MRIHVSPAWLAAACLFFCAPVHAQTVTATVTGTVRDVSDAVVPGAHVQIHNHDTNQMWHTVTDERGRFRIVYLPAGDYHLAVQRSGFTTANANLRLDVNDQVDVPVTLKPAAVSEAVDVEAPAPLVESRRTAIASTVTPHEVDNLPLNGRNYLDLALLAPNVSRTNLRTADRFAETSAVPGTGVSVAGQRNLNNNFVVDGLSANDDAADLAGTYLSQEVVREFEIVTTGGGAEFGRASSGTISVVTQSGTNRHTGRLYEFARNDVFDEQNPLAVREDPLNQHQFGATFGGPITQSRSFWFTNVERTSQHRTGIVTITPASVATVNAALDLSGYRGPRAATGNYSTGMGTTNVFGRVDHAVSGSSQLAVRYNLYGASSQNARGVGGLNDVSRGTALDDLDQSLAANYLSTLSTSTVNELRVQFVRGRLGAPVNDLVGPAVTIAGVASLGTSTSAPTRRDADMFQAVDTVTVQRGAHLMKAGIDVLSNSVDITFPGALQGSYSFSSLATFQRGVYSQYQQSFGQASVHQSNPNAAFFIQDEWQPATGVTIDAGVRYDLQWLPQPVALDANNVSPRVGVAYAPRGGKTVIRASAGLYFDRVPLRATSNAIQRDGTKYQTAVLSPGQTGAPVWPNTLTAFPARVLVSITTINPDVQNQYNRQAAVQIERAVGTAISAQIGYSYIRGHGILMSHNVNVPTLTAAEAASRGVANLGRPNPNYGNISRYDSIGDSWFHGLTASLETRQWKRARIRASYTLSDAQDDAGNAFFQSPQTQNDVLADRGPSDNDQRHRFVLSGTIGDSGWRALGGAQVGWVYSYASAAPFSIVTGIDNNNDTTVNDRPAGEGRNSARLPCFSDLTQSCGTSSLDLRVSRPIAIGSRQKLELMIEGFNVLNRANVINVNATIGSGQPPSASFKQITAVGDMRQLQLGARWNF